MLAEVLQLRERGRPAVDPRAALALRVERAPQQQRCRRRRGPARRARPRRRDASVDVEFGGELGALGAGSQLPQLEAVAEQQAERVEQDRLARAGFAGQHREAGVELEVERFDDDEIADRQQPQHADVRYYGRSRSGVSLQCSFSRSIAKWSWPSGCRKRAACGARRDGDAVAFGQREVRLAVAVQRGIAAAHRA